MLIIFRKKYQNVNRWFSTIINQPKVKIVLGDVKLCDKTPEIPKKTEGMLYLFFYIKVCDIIKF